MKPSVLPVTALAALMLPSVSSAAPYASAVTVAGDTVTFILNETADTVKVVFDEGTSTLVIGGSPETAGLKTFSKAGHTSFTIEVEKNAGPGWRSGVLQQISQDSNDLVKFANGRGLAVNCFPASGPLFGRIYATVASDGNAVPLVTPAVTPRNNMVEGIYALNPDFTATALGAGALTGGISFPATGTGVAEGPYRLTVGPDGALFITDWSDAAGSVYMTDGNVANGENILGGPLGSGFPLSPAASPDPSKIHGSIAAAVVEGSKAGGDLKLWVIDEDLQNDLSTVTQTQRNSVWEWNMSGDPLPMIGPPVLLTSTSGAGAAGAGIGFASQTADLVRGPDGYSYKLQRRANGLESGVFVLSQLWSPVPSHPDILNSGSLPAFRAYTQDQNVGDPFIESVALDVSHDNWLAVLRRSDNAIHLLKMDNGMMDFSSHILLNPTPTTVAGRDIAFDAAGNLYSLSSGQALLRVYAPGGHTLAKTHSNGTFEILQPTAVTPPDPMPLAPVITNVVRSGDDLLISFTSRLGISSAMTLQRTTDPETGPWESMNTTAPDNTKFTITGTSPNFTFRAIGAMNLGERYFYRVKRN